MTLSILPGVVTYLQYGIDESKLVIAAAELAYFASAVICAVGLNRTKEWARKWAVFLFALYFLWTVYVAFSLAGPSFNVLIEQQGELYQMAPERLKVVIISLLLVYSVWPVVVILFLTHPKVKALFKPNYDPIDEEEGFFQV